MSTSNPSQLFLLADHIKLSLLERQRALSLNLPASSQDGQISRSLDSLQSGIEALEARLEQHPDSDLSDQLARLRSSYDGLASQFASPSGSSASPPPAAGADLTSASVSRPSKSVRFTDDPDSDPSRDALFPYRDDPDEASGPDPSALTNQQIHEYHQQVIRDQDDQLDRLGESIGRQRELSIQIGDELDSQALLLDDVDEGVDRHQGQLNRAKRRLDGVARKARENWSMTVIVVLIVILVLLIVITR